MALEKTWAYSLNNLYTPASAVDLTRHWLWWLAATLTGNTGGLTLGLWTLYASSDSVTAGTDATDRWVLAGPYNGAKIVRGAAAAIHSWCVLRSPSMNGNVWYMILSFNSAADNKVRVSFCKTAPTGGSTTVTPTAADQWWMASTSGGGAVDWTNNAAAADVSRRSLGLTSAGDFWFIGCKSSAGVPNLALQFHALSNKKTNDLFPMWSAGEYQAAGVLRLFGTGPFDTEGTGGLGCNHAKNWAGAAATFSAPILFPTVFSNGGGTIWAPTLLDNVDGTYPDFPCWVVTGSIAGAAANNIRGRIADLAISPQPIVNLPEGITVSPNSGTPEMVKVGYLWMPCNSVLNFG